MNVVIFGSFDKRMLAPGWKKETVIALAGGGDFDLTGIEPGENARLTAVAVFGGIDVVVDDNTNVTMGVRAATRRRPRQRRRVQTPHCRATPPGYETPTPTGRDCVW